LAGICSSKQIRAGSARIGRLSRVRSWRINCFCRL